MSASTPAWVRSPCARKITRSCCRWWSPPSRRTPSTRWMAPTWASSRSASSRGRTPRAPCSRAARWSARPPSEPRLSGDTPERSATGGRRSGMTRTPCRGAGSVEFLVVSVLNGVVHGLLLFMVSAGLTLIFGMMGVLNFAHAWFYMLGAYVGFTLTRHGGFWVGLVLAPVVAGLTGVLVERYMLRRVHKYGHAHELLLTFGLAFIIEEVIKLFYGDALVSYQMPDYMRFAAFTIFDTNYPFYRLFMGAVALAMFAVLYLLLTRTRVGIVVRAATYRPSTVEALGHNLPLVFMGVFAGGSALAGLAGAVAGAFYPTGPSMAVDFGTLVFVVVVIGGLGSVVGALIASLMIGLFISFSVGLNVSIADLFGLFGLGPWAQELGGLFTLQLSTVANSMPFLLMLLVLLIRPAGLMGDRQ